MVIAAQAARLEAEAMARNAEAEVRARELVIEQMKFAIAKLRHERFGQSSERSAVLEQLELRLADMEEDAAQAEAAAQMAANAAASMNVKVQAFDRRKPARRPLPALPRERVLYPSPAACPCCPGRHLLPSVGRERPSSPHARGGGRAPALGGAGGQRVRRHRPGYGRAERNMGK